MINRKSIVNSPDDRLRQFNRMPIPNAHTLTDTHSHTHSHRHTLSQTRTLTHTLTDTHSHRHTPHALSHTLSQTHTLTELRCVSLTHPEGCLVFSWHPVILAFSHTGAETANGPGDNGLGYP